MEQSSAAMAEIQQVRLGQQFHAEAGEEVELVAQEGDTVIPVTRITLSVAGRWVIGGAMPTKITDVRAAGA